MQNNSLHYEQELHFLIPLNVCASLEGSISDSYFKGCVYVHALRCSLGNRDRSVPY